MRQPFLIAVLIACAGCVAPGPLRETRHPLVTEAGAPSAPEAPYRFKGDAFASLCQHTFSQIGSDLDPDLSPDGKWLAFSSTRHEERPEVYLKPVNGNAAVRKTFDPATDCQPAFSPDGSRIAFCSDRHGDFDLYLMNTADAKAPTVLTQGDGDEMHPTWSPDGGKIAYCAYDARLGDWELRVVDVATGARSYLGMTGLYPSWSPDGRRIAFQRARERGAHWYSLWTLEVAVAPASAQVETANPVEVVGDPAWAAITPSWSRDGRHLAFATAQEVPGARKDRDSAWRGGALWMIASDGSGLIQLTRPGAAVTSPSWGSDDRVYFVSDRGGGKSIWSLKPMMLEPLAAGAR